MNRNNDFETLLINDKSYDISHLKDLNLTLDMTFNNGDSRTVTVNLRPTNHLFSRAVENEDDIPLLNETGALLVSYKYNKGNFQDVKQPRENLESRVFCERKWNDSLLLPQFVEYLNDKPNRVTVLANAGDVKTCLTGMFEFDDSDNVYLVFFVLTRINSTAVNMLIETAFCVNANEHNKAKRLTDTNRQDKKPFIVVLKNILEGRKPFEGAKSKRKYKAKKAKKTKSPD